MEDFPLSPLCPSFRSAPAAGQLYLTDAHRQLLKRGEGWLDGSCPVMLLTGDAGTGKTILSREFGGAGLRVGRVGQSNAQLVDLPHEVPKAFGIPAQPSPDDPAGFGQLMADCQSDERKCLLVVDEAQGLTDTALAYLTRLTEGPAHPHVLLVGGPGLEALLARSGHEDLRGRIGARFRLSPFDPAETAAYIAHRFRVSGCACHAGGEVFDEAGLELLHAASGGVPRVINHLVQRCLFEARITGGSRIDGAFVQACLFEMSEEGGLAHLPPVPPVAPDCLVAAPAPPAARPESPAARPEPPAAGPALFKEAQSVRATPKLGTAPKSPPRPEERRGKSWQLGLAAVLAGGLLLVPGSNVRTDAPASSPPVQAGLIPASAEPELAAARPSAIPAQRPPLPDKVAIRAAPSPEALLVEALVIGSADPERAATLYARAALWGSDRAAYYLGQLYETGIGVEPDLNRAQGWYGLAPRVQGAAARLAELAKAAPTPVQADAAPVPVAQMLFGSGQTELHWRDPEGPDPARFRVEYVPAGDKGQVLHRDTRLSALLLPHPVTRWRVAPLRPDGSVGPASDWSLLTPAPR